MDVDQHEGRGLGPTGVQAAAAEAFAVLGTGRQVEPFSARHPGFGLDNTYRAAAVRLQRGRRGERPIGRKIGFTNRTIWPEHNVHAPIWGYVCDRTVSDLAGAGSTSSLKGLAEPRIEPEIIFGLATAPTLGMDERASLGRIGWVAHGFEVVQSIFPNWKFTAADTVAAYGLHGALLVGPRHPVAPRIDDWARRLASFEIGPFRDGALADRGHAVNVLDGPVSCEITEPKLPDGAGHAIRCHLPREALGRRGGPPPMMAAGRSHIAMPA